MFKNKTLVTTVFCGLTSLGATVQAEYPSLNDQFDLHLPVVKFQDQFLWADLEIKSLDGEITFAVKDYQFFSDKQRPPEILDLESVTTESGAPEIVDITGSDARLTFVSSIPLACSVVYGKTTEFGSIASDPDMNGAAIIDHNPILTGLEPDTEYFYRVQGSDSAGNIYWAGTQSFMTTASASAGSSDPNLLSINNGALISAVSSNFGGAGNDQTWGANSAIDGSSNTAWSSSGDGDNAFIEITLPEQELVSTLEVWSRSMSDGSAIIQSFTVITDAGEVLGPFSLPGTSRAYSFDIDRITGSIRLDVETSTGGNTGLVEISAFNNGMMM